MARAVVALAILMAAAGGCRRRSPSARASADAGPPATAHIDGRVVDRLQRPVPEARVLVFPLGGEGHPVETATDMDGHFRVEHLQRALHRVLVDAAGFPTAERASVPAPSDGLVVSVDGQGSAVVGRVEAGGAPVAGAHVWLAPDVGGPIRDTVTRAGGGFAFGGLGQGRYAVRAVHGAAASATARAIEAGDAAAASTLRLELAAGQMVGGRVIDDAGAGLPGIEVRLEISSEAPGADPLPTLVRSDGAGRFSAGPVPPGSYRLSASRPGHILRRAPLVEVAPPPAAAPAASVLELVRGARVAGRVRDGHGAPAVGARVRCVASAIDDLTVQTGPLPLAAEAAAMPSGAGRALGSTRVTTVDRDGRFSVDDLIPGRYHLEIAQPGAEPFRSDEIVVAPGEHRDAGILALRAGLPVEGRVVDESGAAIEGAHVVVTGTGATAAAPGLYALSDAAGHFALALPPGGYRLTATASGRGTAQAPLELATGAAPAPIQIKLLRAEASLEGLVRDTGGRPLGRARIVVWPADVSASPVGGGSTDVGGHFTIAGLPAGDLRLEIQHPDYPPFSEGVPAGKYALVTVPFPGGVSGEIRARATGAAVPRARVDAVGPGGARAAAEIRKTGAFRLMRLVPGRWRLTVVAPGFRAAEQELDVTASLTLGEPSLRDVRVELDPS